jgi:hypothetical protein
MQVGPRKGEEAVVAHFKSSTQLCLKGQTNVRAAAVLADTDAGSCTCRSGALPPREPARCIYIYIYIYDHPAHYVTII